MKLLFIAFLVYLLKKFIDSKFFEKSKQNENELLRKILSFIISLSIPIMLAFNAVKLLISYADPLLLYIATGTENIFTKENLDLLKILPILYQVGSMAPMEIFLVSILSLGCSTVVVTGFYFILYVNSRCRYYGAISVDKTGNLFSQGLAPRQSQKLFLTLCQLRN